MQAGVQRAHIPAYLDAGAVGEPSVQDRDIRLERGDAARGLRRGSALTDHLEPFALKQVLQPLPDKLVVIENEHAQRLLGTCSPFRARLMPLHPNAPICL